MLIIMVRTLRRSDLRSSDRCSTVLGSRSLSIGSWRVPTSLATAAVADWLSRGGRRVQTSPTQSISAGGAIGSLLAWGERLHWCPAVLLQAWRPGTRGGKRGNGLLASSTGYKKIYARCWRLPSLAPFAATRRRCPHDAALCPQRAQSPLSWPYRCSASASSSSQRRAWWLTLRRWCRCSRLSSTSLLRAAMRRLPDRQPESLVLSRAQSAARPPRRNQKARSSGRPGRRHHHPSRHCIRSSSCNATSTSQAARPWEASSATK